MSHSLVSEFSPKSPSENPSPRVGARKHVFVCEEHKEYGAKGWRPKNIPNFDPLSGMAIPHDVLEHFADDDGDAEGEFQALGAALFVRGDGGYWDGRHVGNRNVGENVGSDFPMVFSLVLNGDVQFEAPPKTKRCAEHVEEWIETAVNYGVKISVDEFFDYAIEKDPSFSKQIKTWAKWAEGWLRVGYRRAQERYKAIGAAGICKIFRQIQEEADRALKHAEIGDELRITVNVAKRFVDVEHVEGWSLAEDDDVRENPDLVKKGKDVYFGEKPVRVRQTTESHTEDSDPLVQDLRKNTVIVGPFGAMGEMFGYDKNTGILLFLVHDSDRKKAVEMLLDESSKGVMPIFARRRASYGPGTLDMFWENPKTKKLTKLCAAAVQFFTYDSETKGHVLVVTHMSVRPKWRNNRLNALMIDFLVAHEGAKTLEFEDVTKDGEKFMQSYGGSAYEGGGSRRKNPAPIEPKRQTITDSMHDHISSLTMPYDTIAQSDWKKVRMSISDICDVRGLRLSERALSNFRQEWLRRRKQMR